MELGASKFLYQGAVPTSWPGQRENGPMTHNVAVCPQVGAVGQLVDGDDGSQCSDDPADVPEPLHASGGVVQLAAGVRRRLCDGAVSGGHDDKAAARGRGGQGRW